MHRAHGFVDRAHGAGLWVYDPFIKQRQLKIRSTTKIRNVKGYPNLLI
jgi:hypothetical protein